LLLGTDKDSRQLIRTDLIEYFEAFGQVNEIALWVPQYKEWLACVTFVDPDEVKGGPKVEPTFQVVACVGSSAVKDVHYGWTQEDKPGQLWTTHIEPGPKGIKEILAFTGRGRWF